MTVTIVTYLISETTSDTGVKEIVVGNASKSDCSIIGLSKHSEAHLYLQKDSNVPDALYGLHRFKEAYALKMMERIKESKAPQ
jgi:hypothetical protein